MGTGLKVDSWGTSLGTGSGRVRVSGADFLRGRSLETERDSGASVHMGVVGALAGPLRAQEDRDVSLIEMDGGNIPIFWLVASWMARSNSLTSSIVMSGSERDRLKQWERELRKVAFDNQRGNKAGTADFCLSVLQSQADTERHILWSVHQTDSKTENTYYCPSCFIVLSSWQSYSFRSSQVEYETEEGQWRKGNNEKDTYTCFVMDLYVIQWRWVCCGTFLLLKANFNVGFLMHLTLVIPHVIQSHIWKKGGGNEGRNVGHYSTMTLQLKDRLGGGGGLGSKTCILWVSKELLFFLNGWA